MYTIGQIIAHIIGDYVIQSDWMALNKTKSWKVALIHGFTYTLPFLFLSPSIFAFLLIMITHTIIDHYSLAKYLIEWKNRLLCDKIARMHYVADEYTGMHKDRIESIKWFVYIVVDNILHILINGLVLTL